MISLFSQYDYLAEFVAIVEAGSISEAAAKLRISQSAASKHLAALESSLGCQLLRRDRHTCEATEVGLDIYEAAKSILDIGTRVERVVLKKTPFRVLTLFDSLGLFRAISLAVKEFETLECPHMRVRLAHERFYGNPSLALENGDVDLVIYDEISFPGQVEGYEAVTLGVCPFVGVVSASGDFRARAELQVSDLKDQRLTRLTGKSDLLNHVWHSIKTECQSHGFTPSYRMRKILWPGEVPGLDIEPDEVLILPFDSQSAAPMAADPSFCCLPITDFSHTVKARYRADNDEARVFSRSLQKHSTQWGSAC